MRHAHTVIPAIAFLLVTSNPALATTDQALTKIDGCLAQLAAQDPAVTKDSPVKLSQVCPAVAGLLQDPALAQLEPALAETTSLAQLHDVRRSLASFKPGSTTGQQPDTAELQQVLTQVYQPEQEPVQTKTAMDKLADWLNTKVRQLFEGDNWFSRHFEPGEISGTDVVIGIRNSIIVLLIVLVLYIIANELYAADIFKLLARKQRARRAQRDDVVQTQHAASTGIHEISELPLNRQVPALLRYVLQYLMARQILPHRYTLTNQEFLAIIQEQHPAASRDFEILVQANDRILYGRKSLASGDASKLFEHAKNIEQVSKRMQA